MKVKFSKWLEGEKVCVEVYHVGKEPTRDTSKEAVKSRTVAVKEGAYFNIDGSFSHWGNNKSLNAPVIVLANNKEITLTTNNGKSMTFEQFLNRVQWAFGESAGDNTTTVATYYAHTINNLSKKYSTENGMYQNATTGASITSEEGISYIQKSKQWGYKGFRENFRKDAHDTDNISNINGKSYFAQGARVIIKAHIDAITKVTSDPTDGATNWTGDQKEDWTVNNSFPNSTVTTVISPIKLPTYKKNENGKKIKIADHNVTHSFHKLQKGSKSKSTVKHIIIDATKEN